MNFLHCKKEVREYRLVTENAEARSKADKIIFKIQSFKNSGPKKSLLENNRKTKG